MTVTRDVILDLLPLYFAGQVSADTKTLVDEFLVSKNRAACQSRPLPSAARSNGRACCSGTVTRRSVLRSHSR